MQDVAIKQPPRFSPYGTFLLLERIAIGGMAEVYLAKSFEGGRASELFAVKRILPSLAEDAEFIRMFLDEAKIAGQLAHPGIVKIRELGRVGSSHYLAMDFVWGKDLLHIMRRARMLGTELSPSFVAWVGAGMCEALHYAHEKTDRQGQPMHLVHRDVSPQNVLVSFDGRVKIIDFGIAKAASRNTRTQAGVLKGKVGYMSPEQVQARGGIDRRSDLFAVGTCLYELLTLRSLFARENNFDAMEAVRNARAEPIRSVRPDVPEELERILQRALARDPDDRWPTAREMQYALLHFINLEDPGYDRVAAVSWLRDAFHKELRQERVRLDAFDQVGRPQVSPADAPPRASVTDLEIPVRAAPPPELDDDETLVADVPVSLAAGELPDATPSEVFWSGRAAEEEPDEAREAESVATPAPPRDAGATARLPRVGDVSLSPAQIDSGVIRQLLPVQKDASNEPTSRQRPVKRASLAPPKRSADGYFVRVALGLVLLALGALGAYAWTSFGARGSIDVRTVPEVGASVLVNGAPRGSAPLRLEGVEPGRYVVTIVADGYRDATREIDVAANGSAHVEIVLEPVDPAR